MSELDSTCSARLEGKYYNNPQYLDISIHTLLLSLSTPQNISNAIKRNVCNISISGGHYASASEYCQAHLDTPLTLGARKGMYFLFFSKFP